MYVYIKSESCLWTVGFYDPKGKFQPESDWSSTDEAAARVHWLNGNEPYQQMEKKCTELENRLSALEPAPAAPVKMVWHQAEKVWYWSPRAKKVFKCFPSELRGDDLWQPVLDPNEPAPEGPEQGR